MNDEPEVAASLVPLDDDGSFLVVGDQEALSSLGVVPAPFLPQQTLTGVHDALALTAGVANLGMQAVALGPASAGLVRLAPETLALLKAGARPLVSGGWNTGALSDGSKIVAQVRWASPGAAGAAPVLAALGPALALVAVQWQLTKLSQAVERNITLTQTVLDELRSEAWHELHAAAAVVLEEVRHAQAIGGVTDSVWDYLQAQSSLATLQKHRARHLDDLQRRRTAWLASGERSAEWFRDNYHEVLRDGQSVLAAQQAIALHHVLRVAHLRRSDDESDRALATAVLASAQAQHLETADLVDRALRDLHASLALWYDASPGDRVPVAGSKVPLREVVQAVRALHDRAVDGPFSHLARLEEPPPAPVGEFVSVAERDRPILASRLRWVLAPAEQAHFVAYGSFSFGEGETRRLLVVTDERALMMDWSDLKGGVARVQELPRQAALSLTRKDKRERVELSCDGRSGLLVVDESPGGGLMAALTRWQEDAPDRAPDEPKMLI